MEVLGVYRGTFSIVDLAALKSNVKAALRQLEPGKRLLVAVKANGYGHGAVEVARAVLEAGATDLGVASLEEGIELRNEGIKAPILIFGAVSPRAASVAAEAGISIALSDDWSDLKLPKFTPSLRVHLKVDTGMNRLGLRDLPTILKVSQWLAYRDDIRFEGVFTHLASADEVDLTKAEKQIAQFERIHTALDDAGLRPTAYHAANSAAIIRRPDWHYDMVRLGISAYGYPPGSGWENPVILTPTLHLYGKITRVATVHRGESVGYGGTFEVTETTKIATVPVGYADGYPRYLSNRAQVLVRGQRANVVGRICMDQLMVDVGHIDGVRPGDYVTLYGRTAPVEWESQDLDALPWAEQERVLAEGFRRDRAKGDADETEAGRAHGNETRGLSWIRLDELASIGGTISYELMCALSARVPRIYVDQRKG